MSKPLRTYVNTNSLRVSDTSLGKLDLIPYEKQVLDQNNWNCISLTSSKL